MADCHMRTDRQQLVCKQCGHYHLIRINLKQYCMNTNTSTVLQAYLPKVHLRHTALHYNTNATNTLNYKAANKTIVGCQNKSSCIY